jgi:hypothetical protein
MVTPKLWIKQAMHYFELYHVESVIELSYHLGVDLAGTLLFIWDKPVDLTEREEDSERRCYRPSEGSVEKPESGDAVGDAVVAE